jgi:sucrose-phosphate synthase
MMDRYDLYGKLAIPKWHDSERDVPELYRIAAERRGVFVNPGFTELFGLTIIEAAATGLPFVATENGGPQDIAANCASGLLVDVSNEQQLSRSIIRLLTDTEFWDRCSTNGVNRVREHYSWETHCAKYLKCLKDVVRQPTKTPSATGRSAAGRRLASVNSMLITDIDNTLLGDDDALALLREFLHEHRDHTGFGIASGRSLELAAGVLERNGIDEIDVIIAAVGSEIYYGKEHAPDKGWASHLRLKWRPDRVREALGKLPFLHLQEEPQAQREFKISYDLDEKASAEEALARIHDALARARAAYKLVFSHGTFIDILPHRASKGKAVRYLSGKWNIPLEKIATAGDSGNDRDMLVGQTAGIVVANHTDELESLRKSKTHRIYFAEGACARGILEGLQHFGFTDADSSAREAEPDDLEGALTS